MNLFENLCYKYYTIETVSAPSGEWAEYNVHYLKVNASFLAARKLLETLGFSKQINAIEERIALETEEEEI